MIDDLLSVRAFADLLACELSRSDLYYGHGSQDAEDEAHWLASYVADFKYGSFKTDWENILTPGQIEKGRKILKHRIESRKPLAYLINQIWFAGHRFYIDERALVPRSHLGEWIPDKFKPWVKSDKVKSILDLCCGGGSIGIASALYFDDVNVDLADLSKDALEVAQKNIDDYRLNHTVKIIHSDLFENIKGQYDLILCNPPYVSKTNMQKLPQEYQYEPEMALISGDKGLDSISIILNQVDQFLTTDGVLVLEAGSAAPALEDTLSDVPLTWLMSDSGESVVLFITRQELLKFKEQIVRLTI